MRLAIEPYAAGLAAERATPAAVAAMRAIVAQMAAAPDRRSFAVADIELHRAVIRASGNVFMQSVGALIEAALLSSFWISSPAENPIVAVGRRPPSIGGARGRHRRGDAAAAADAMRQVIDTGRDRVSLAL